MNILLLSVLTLSSILVSPSVFATTDDDNKELSNKERSEKQKLWTDSDFMQTMKKSEVSGIYETIEDYYIPIDRPLEKREAGKVALKEVLTVTENMKKIGDIGNACSTYTKLGLVDKVVNCISFMKEFNTQIKSVIDNYYLKENIPTTTADEVIRESMLDDPNLPSNVKIINNEIYRQQIENLNKK